MTTKKEYPFFMRLCWFLDSIHMHYLAAALRVVAYWALRTTREAKPYKYPERVGYLAWIEDKRVGVIAFVREDNSIQFVW